MNVVSVNVGLPGELRIGDRLVATGIFKAPVAGPVRLRTLNFEGDGQADLSVHGGPDKAVYLYPSEHYGFWEHALSQDLEWGAFGENLTLEGFVEDAVSVGDKLGIGTAVLQITQPRLPCFKLAAKFERDDIIQQFLESRRTGFYARVLHEGTVQAGDAITVLHHDPAHVTIREIADVYLTKQLDRSNVERVLSVEALATSWREHFSRMLQT